MTHYLISGGNGRLATQLKKQLKEYVVLSPSKEEMNIHDYDKVVLFVKNFQPNYFIHAAALTNPMRFHEEYPEKSVLTNIIGTANIVRACIEHNIKLIYISTDYVYPGTKGNYKETSPLLPHNNYAWSKLGGECSVQMYKNSLILRVAMCNWPWRHKKCFTDDHKNWMFERDIAKLTIKLKDEIGIINVGGPSISSYNFVKKFCKNPKPISIKDAHDVKMCKNSSMSLDKLNRIINNVG